MSFLNDIQTTYELMSLANKMGLWICGIMVLSGCAVCLYIAIDLVKCVIKDIKKKEK